MLNKFNCKKISILIAIIFSAITFAQEADSLKVNNQTEPSEDYFQNLDQDTSQTKVIPDTLKPIYKNSYNLGDEYNSVLHKKNLNRSDYRSAGDFVKFMPGGFLQHLGTFNQPSEAVIYSMGYNQISWSMRNMEYNSPVTNSFNYSLFQMEETDSIEVVPLAEGFWLSPVNNPVYVNIIPEDEIPYEALTRIKFFSGGDEEGLADVYFSTLINNKLIGTLHVSNSYIATRYDNSEAGFWQISPRFKYLLSKKINIIAGLDHVRSNTQLFGGVDYNELLATTLPDEVEETFYNPLNAPVFFPTASGYLSGRYEKQTNNRFYVNILGNLFKESFTDITLFYEDNLREFRQNEYELLPDIEKIVNDDVTKKLGATITQKLDYSFARLDVKGDIEHQDISSQTSDFDDKFMLLSAGGKLTLKIPFLNIYPSVFAKVINYNDRTYKGSGAGFNFNYLNDITVYAGVSAFEKPLPIIYNRFENSDDPENYYIFESAVRYQNENNRVALGYYIANQTDKAFPYLSVDTSSTKNFTVDGIFRDDLFQQGVYLNFNLNYFVFGVEGNASYTNSDMTNVDQQLPEFSFAGGVYYQDILFDRNLDLKTGINFYFNTAQTYSVYDFRSQNRIFYQNKGNNITALDNSLFGDSYRIDFFLAGRLQERATIYLVFENITGNDHYIIPYYPNSSAGLRYGFIWSLFN